MYLLDTDTLIYIIKGEEQVVKHLRLHLNDTIKVSVITLMELYYGAYKSQKISTNLAKIKKIETSLEVIPVEEDAVAVFGSLKAKHETQGNRLDDFDLAIATCALVNDLTLISNNLKHFQRIEGLKLDNWKL